MSTLLDHPLPTLPPPPPKDRRGWQRFLPQWSKRTWRVLAAVGAIIFFFGMWLFYFSSVFALESLVVEGVRTVNPADVGQRADLGAGTPLARVNAEDVESRILGIPAVQSVNVSRRWPNMIVISVVERDRVATMKEGERWATLDAQGFPFESTKKKPQGLPIVEAPEGAARAAAIAVAASLPPALATKVSSVAAADPENVILSTSSGATVVWGPSEQNELKARILLALLAKSKDKWFDLRIPTTPTSAQSSPKPAPPPTPKPSTSPGAVEGDQPLDASTPGEGIPTIPGVVPSSLAPTPSPGLEFP